MGHPLASWNLIRMSWENERCCLSTAGRKLWVSVLSVRRPPVYTANFLPKLPATRQGLTDTHRLGGISVVGDHNSILDAAVDLICDKEAENVSVPPHRHASDAPSPAIVLPCGAQSLARLCGLLRGQSTPQGGQRPSGNTRRRQGRLDGHWESQISQPTFDAPHRPVVHPAFRHMPESPGPRSKAKLLWPGCGAGGNHRLLRTTMEAVKAKGASL